MIVTHCLLTFPSQRSETDFIELTSTCSRGKLISFPVLVSRTYLSFCKGSGREPSHLSLTLTSFCYKDLCSDIGPPR